MPTLPFVVAALSLVWASLFGMERVSVVMWAVVAPFLAALFLAYLWPRIGIHKCNTARLRWINAVLGLVCLLVFVSVPSTHWPIRAAFQLSKPSFEAVAQSLRSGTQFGQPVQVGLFSIEKAEIYDVNGKVCLWTSLATSGRIGCTQCPPKDVPLNFNLWSQIELDSNWQYISED